MIRPLYPVQEPFSKAPSGFSFMGVVEYDDAADRVRCHECGEWRQYLGPHISKLHRMTTRGYRLKYGLNFNMALCGRRLSAQRRRQMTKQIKTIGHRALRKRIRSGVPNKPAAQNGNLTEAQKNKHGLCDEQIKARYNLVKRRVKRQPTTGDLEKFDLNLLSAIQRRHGTLNKYRVIVGEQPMTRGDYLTLTEADLLDALRKWKTEHGRVPTVRDFRKRVNGYPQFSVYFGRFGSWRAALNLAGINNLHNCETNP